MADEEFAELNLQSSDFIREYVEQHKQELDELRAKATAAYPLSKEYSCL